MPLIADDDDEFILADQDSDEGEQRPDHSFRNRLYPERGLFPHTKDFLIDKLESEGGPHACTRQNQKLDRICDNHKLELGNPDSELRKRVRVCAYHWKGKPTLYATAKRKKKEREEAATDAATTTTPPVPAPVAPPTEILAPRRPRPAPTLSPPPKIIKKHTSMFSPSKKNKDSSSGKRSCLFLLALLFRNLNQAVCFLSVLLHDFPGNFTVDLSEEEQLGPLIVIPFIHEEIANKWVSGLAFVKPAVSLDEIQEDINEAVISQDKRQVEFTMPKTETKFRRCVMAWKAIMTKNKKSQKTGKLKETMASFAVTAGKEKTKYVYKLSEEDSEVKLSNEYFTARGSGESKVDHIMVPYEYEVKGPKGKVYNCFEALLIWRVYFEGTEKPKGDGTPTQIKDKVDELADLLAGSSI